MLRESRPSIPPQTSLDLYTETAAEGVPSCNRPSPAADSVPRRPANDAVHLSWGPDGT